jgi:hypothetical protein
MFLAIAAAWTNRCCLKALSTGSGSDRQQHKGMDEKRALFSDTIDGCAQGMTDKITTEVGLVLVGDLGDEVGAACNAWSYSRFHLHAPHPIPYTPHPA